jgi:hypothetical protein
MGRDDEEVDDGVLGGVDGVSGICSDIGLGE